MQCVAAQYLFLKEVEHDSHMVIIQGSKNNEVCI